MWVQCGTGRLSILEASFEGKPDATPFEALATAAGGRLPLMLG
jgi:hypothetical protein